MWLTYLHWSGLLSTSRRMRMQKRVERVTAKARATQRRMKK
jgi:hypothetical protein